AVGSFRRRPHAGRIVGFVVARDDEAVIGRPGELDLVAARPELGPRGPLDVLLVDHQRPASRFDEVLGADPDVGRVADDAGQVVVPGRSVVGRLAHADLLGPYAGPDVRG